MRFVTSKPHFVCCYMFLKHIFVLVFRNYSPNTIHRYYSLARGALSVRCWLFGAKFGSLFDHMLVVA